MPRFFVTEINEDSAQITGEDAAHIRRVLRMHCGDAITVSDGNGYDYDCEIESLDEAEVWLHIHKKYPNATEPNLRVTLFQALPKGDKLELIIQKSVELGVSEIVPVLTKRCVSRPDSASFSKKLPRYQKIAEEAAKQCGRGMIPRIGEMLTLEAAIPLMKISAAPLVFYEGGGSRVCELVKPGVESSSILIGSEGGFEEAEVDACRAAGVWCATLGRRILRCETAPLAALTLLHNAAGEM